METMDRRNDQRLQRGAEERGEDGMIVISKRYISMATVSKMKEIVSEHKSKYFVYDALDRKQINL